jgi:hypothetical protein
MAVCKQDIVIINVTNDVINYNDFTGRISKKPTSSESFLLAIAIIEMTFEDCVVSLILKLLRAIIMEKIAAIYRCKLILVISIRF